MQKMKKKKSKKKENEALRGTEGKPKKKRKKSLGSSIESNAGSSIESNAGSSIESNATKPGEQMSESKKKNWLAGLPIEGNAVELTIGDASTISSNEIVYGDSSGSDNNNLFSFDDTVLSHLQKQFEKVAAEAGMLGASNPKVSKKRKLSKNTDTRQALVSSKNVGGSDVEKTMESNVKKDRFSMKNNVIWNSQNPLLPQSARIPPSVIPRGCALKKGFFSRLNRERPPTVKKIKVKGISMKKPRKILKKVSPVVKHIRLLRGFFSVDGWISEDIVSHI